MTITRRPLPPGENLTLRRITLNAAARSIVLGTAEHGQAVTPTPGPSPFLASDPSTGGKAFLARLYALALAHGEIEPHPAPATTPTGDITLPLEHLS